MTNNQYIEKILSSVDRILVDTSTLMSHGFQQFVLRNKEKLLVSEKKLIVPKAVYSELARHMGSDNLEKSELAVAAVELLSLNKEIFQVENTQLTEEEIARAFADAQLLSELTLHRSDSRQLLLTNDRKLSCDAFDLNQQQSCKGRKVLVCYINCCGEMQCCECARTNADKAPETRMLEKVESVPDSAAAETPVAMSADIPCWKFEWKSATIGAAATVILYGLFKGGKALLHYMKNNGGNINE